SAGTLVRQSSAAATSPAATTRTIVAPLSKRVAVISDVHANRHALDAVLEAIAAVGADELWCLGDLVGYGPQPNECCRTVAAHADLYLAGNHDLVVLGSLSIHGSVGQPRDGDPRAAFLSLEPGRRAAFHRAEYPIERTQTEMREHGLPETLASRLEEGLYGGPSETASVPSGRAARPHCLRP